MLVKDLLKLLEGVDPEMTVFVEDGETMTFANPKTSGVVEFGHHCDAEGNPILDENGKQMVDDVPQKGFAIFPTSLQLKEV